MPVYHAVLCWILSLVPLTAGPAPATQPAGQPPSATQPAERVDDAALPAAHADDATRRIVIISIDGARPDLLLRANTPTVHALLPQSTFTFWARTTPHAVTLPSHTSMLTGVNPNRHGILWNSDLKFAEPVYPNFPTLFEVAHGAGLTTAMVVGKSKFSVLNKPGTIDWASIPEGETSEDFDVALKAVDLIRSHRPHVLFVHLPGVDTAGHKYGWSSPEQMRALEGADAAIAQILAALATQNLLDKTVLLITADHGGAGLGHGPDDPRSRFIPWIISGPGIRRGLDLTLYPKTSVETEDTFATAARLLGLNPGVGIDGEAVLEILEKPTELLRAD